MSLDETICSYSALLRVGVLISSREMLEKPGKMFRDNKIAILLLDFFGTYILTWGGSVMQICQERLSETG